MARVVIRVSKRYAEYLAKHLAKEHPKTKGHIRVLK